MKKLPVIVGLVALAPALGGCISFSHTPAPATTTVVQQPATSSTTATTTTTTTTPAP